VSIGRGSDTIPVSGDYLTSASAQARVSAVERIGRSRASDERLSDAFDALVHL